MAKIDVYGIGNALVDMEFRVSDEFFHHFNIEKGLMTLVDEKRQEELLNYLKNKNNREVKRQCGGSAANSMIAISQFGGTSFYSCKVASDDAGKFYLGDLQENNVKTNSDFEKLEDGTTGKCMVLITEDAERTMNTYLGVSTELSKKEVSPLDIKNSKWVYVEGYLVASETAQEASLYALDVATESGVKKAFTFSDPNMIRYFRDNVNAITKKGLDLIFCNRAEALEFCETNDLELAMEKLKKISKNYVLTKGPEGAVIWDGNNYIEIESHKVEAIDTNGAGDMFAGAFLYGITNGFSMEKAGRLASLASSKVVSQYGPRLTYSLINEVLEKI